jgi:hypothetical protein
MDTPLDRLIAGLPQLDDVGLAEVEKRIKFLRRTAKVTGADTDSVVTDFDAKVTLQAIIDTLRKLSLPSFNATHLEDRRDREALVAKSRHLHAFLRKNGFATKSERLIALKLGFYLLARQMNVERQEVSFNTLAAQAHRVAARIDAEFPGYAQAGMLHFILKHNRAA